MKKWYGWGGGENIEVVWKGEVGQNEQKEKNEKKKEKKKRVGKKKKGKRKKKGQKRGKWNSAKFGVGKGQKNWQNI